MKTLTLRRKYRGVALFLSLVLLVVLTLIAVTIMSNTAIQERMSGNQKRVADAGMAAEAAIASHLAWLSQDLAANWAQVPAQVGLAQEFGGASRFFINSWRSEGDPANNCSSSDDRCVVSATGESVAAGTALARVNLEAEFIFDIFSDPIGGGADILCGGDLDMRRVRFTNVYAHCDDEDSSVSTVGQGTGQNRLVNSRVTSRGTASVPVSEGNCVDRCSVEGNYQDGPGVPTIGERVRGDWGDSQSFFDTVKRTSPPSIEFYNVDSDFVPGETAVSRVSLDPAVLTPGTGAYMGDMTNIAVCGSTGVRTCDFSDLTASDEPRVLFCNGNVNFGGGGANPISNLTVIATCDITHNGRAQQGGAGEVNNVFYAGGDMIFNGRTGGQANNNPDLAEAFEGRFFAGGNATFNGNATITGQLMTEGDITTNGWLTFFGARSLGGGVDSSEEQKLVMTLWRQRWFDE